METVYYALNPWWEEKDFDAGVPRPEYLARLPELLKRRQIEVIIGSRRVGKTTLLKQFIKQLILNGTPPKDLFYIALDNPALSAVPVSEHLKNMRKMFMHERERKLFFFLDEVHESPDWEAELKSIYDMENIKIFCSGSTYSLITQQGSRLTGRQVVSTIFPLSFNEFILFQGGQPSLSEDYKYERLLEKYLNTGGYPEHVLNPSVEYLSNLLDDILARDLIRLYPIKKAFALKDLLKLISASVGSRVSHNKLSKTLGLAVDTVKEYVNYLESAFLLGRLEKWTTSFTERVYAQKKLYLWDTGIKTLLTGPGDEGYKAENLVFMELKKRKIDCGYFAESEKEVDFVTGNMKEPVPIEVKFLSSLDWTERRYSGLKLFLRRYSNTRECLLITKNVETEMNVNKTRIKAIPLWRFLLSSDSYIQGPFSTTSMQ